MNILTLALLLLAFGQPAPGLSGKWSGSFHVSGSDDHVPQFFILTQAGTKLTGTGGPDASERYPIADGQVRGHHVTFDLTNAFAKFSYDLTDSGGQMKGRLIIRSIHNTLTADLTSRKSTSLSSP